MSLLACDLSDRQRAIRQRKFDANRSEYRRLQERLANPNLPGETRIRLEHRFDRLATEILPRQFAELIKGVDQALMAERLKKREVEI